MHSIYDDLDHLARQPIPPRQGRRHYSDRRFWPPVPDPRHYCKIAKSVVVDPLISGRGARRTLGLIVSWRGINGHRCRVDFTTASIANALGVDRSTVSRHLNELDQIYLELLRDPHQRNKIVGCYLKGNAIPEPYTQRNEEDLARVHAIYRHTRDIRVRDALGSIIAQLPRPARRAVECAELHTNDSLAIRKKESPPSNQPMNAWDLLGVREPVDDGPPVRPWSPIKAERLDRHIQFGAWRAAAQRLDKKRSPEYRGQRRSRPISDDDPTS